MGFVKKTEEKKMVVQEERRKKIEEDIKAAENRRDNYLCVGIWGSPKTAKTGIALDLLTEEDIKNGLHVFVWDFDGRAIDVKRNHYENLPNIKVYNPIVRKENTLADFKETMKNAIEFHKMAQEYLEKGKLKAVVVDGADKLLTDICETKMREKHNLDADDVIKAPPYMWGDRNMPYKNFLHKTIMEMDCHRIVVAHSKDKYSGTPNPVGIEANWHSTTEDLFTSTVQMRRELFKDGARYFGLVEASANSPELIGKQFTILTINKGKITWKGLPAVKEGVL